jgi:hypothetical protein
MKGDNMNHNLFQQAADQYKKGNVNEAGRLLQDLVAIEPMNEHAWYALAVCCSSIAEKQQYLKKALLINPKYEKAKAALEKTVQKIEEDQKPGGNYDISDKDTDKNLENKVSSSSTKMRYTFAGASTFQMEKDRRRNGFTITVIAIIVIIFLGFVILPNYQILGISGTGILILLLFIRFLSSFMLSKADKKFDEADRAYRGAESEIQVSELLDELGEDYVVFNDILGDYGNIDHVIICRQGGVFVVETKSHYGKISVDMDQVLINNHEPEKDFIAQSIRNSLFLQENIANVIGYKPWVTIFLVFTHAFVPLIQPIKGVHIINKRFLLNQIKKYAINYKNGQKVWNRRDEIFMFSDYDGQ